MEKGRGDKIKRDEPLEDSRPVRGGVVKFHEDDGDHITDTKPKKTPERDEE